MNFQISIARRSVTETIDASKIGLDNALEKMRENLNRLKEKLISTKEELENVKEVLKKSFEKTGDVKFKV